MGKNATTLNFMLRSWLVYQLSDEHAAIILVYMLRILFNYGVIKSFVPVISAYADVKEVN